MLALLSHGYLPCSLESDEKLLEMSRGLGTGGAGASRHRGQQRARGGESTRARSIRSRIRNYRDMASRGKKKGRPRAY